MIIFLLCGEEKENHLINLMTFFKVFSIFFSFKEEKMLWHKDLTLGLKNFCVEPNAAMDFDGENVQFLQSTVYSFT